MSLCDGLRVASAGLCAFALGAVMFLGQVGPATATEYINWSAPTGAKGWCTYGPGPGNSSCYGDPLSACSAQYGFSGNTGGFLGIGGSTHWSIRDCLHQWVFLDTLLTNVDFLCLNGFQRVAPGICVRTNENFPPPCPNCGATPTPATPGPIVILDGAKRFAASDFALADGGLPLVRQFSSRPSGGSGNTLVNRPLGAANWRFELMPELHLAGDWESSGIVGLSTGDGGHYRFTKSGSVMVPTTSTSYPIKNTDYALEFVGTWPATNADVKRMRSTWIVRDAQSRVWHFESQYNPRTARFDVARPTRRVEPDGLELVYQYADGALLSITDSHGRRLDFEWLRVVDMPVVISAIGLPDGTTLNYAYEATASGETFPGRLAAVERRQGATVLDRTAYDHADGRYPDFVTGIRDRDNVARWTVAYDDEYRAISSSGPGGTDAHTVSYGANGATFTRTTTNPLGKQTIYTFSRTSSNYNIKLTSVAEQASTNSPASTTGMTFSGSNYLATQTDAENRVTGYTRDTNARPIQVVEAQGTAVARTTTIGWHSVRNTPDQVTEPGLTTANTFTAGTSAGGPPEPVYVATQSFAFTGAPVTYNVPGGVTTATVRLWGGAGGTTNQVASAWSGAGGYVEATFAVAPGDVLTFEVAGGGEGAIASGPGGNAGWPDGGPGSYYTYPGAGGGGSTRFYINSVLKAVAGGGGGSAGSGIGGHAGAGGGLTAQSATGNGGTGGSQTAAGFDRNASGNANKMGRSVLAFPGAQRTGGWGNGNGTNSTTTSDQGGGGGGGYWGGGGGGESNQSGGGGSSWVDPSATVVVNRVGFWPTPFTTPPGLSTIATGVFRGTTLAAVKGGDGYAMVGVK